LDKIASKKTQKGTPLSLKKKLGSAWENLIQLRTQKLLSPLPGESKKKKRP